MGCAQVDGSAVADTSTAVKDLSMGTVVRPDRKPHPGPLDRLLTLAGGGPILVMTARFGRSPVRDLARRFCARHRDLDFRLSWRLFANLEDWGKRWKAEQRTFAAGLILSAAHDPVAERAVGRCLADLALLDRPLLWVVTSDRLRWHPRFAMVPNGWSPEEMLPHPAAYARLNLAHHGEEFRPQFDPILFAPEPDFLIFNGRLRWLDARHHPYALAARGA